MEEKTLLMCSIFFSFLGISVLYLILLNTDVNHSFFIEEDLGKDVRLTGTVMESNSGEVSFVEINTMQHIPVVFFEELNVDVGEEIEIIGRVEYYNNELEIIGKKLLRQ